MNSHLNKYQKSVENLARQEEARLDAQAKRLRAKNSAGSKKLAAFLEKTNRGSSKRKGSYTLNSKSLRVIYKKHKGGLAAVSYSQKKSQGIFYTNCFGSNTIELLNEFSLDQKIKPMIKKNLFQHITLSFPSGSKQTPEQIKNLIDQFFKNINADGQFVSFLHNDTKNEHVHIIFSRLNKNGSLLSDSNDFFKHREASHKASEKIFGCSEIQRQSTNFTNSDREKNSKEKAIRLNRKFEHIDPNLIFEVMQASQNTQEFQSNLKTAGIDLKPTEKNGKITGIAFKTRNSETWIAGSAIHRTLSLQKIQDFFNSLKERQQIIQNHHNQHQKPRVDSRLNHFHRTFGG